MLDALVACLEPFTDRRTPPKLPWPAGWAPDVESWKRNAGPSFAMSEFVSAC
jgi:hypothetical protein